MSFLPPAPHAAFTVELADPPALQPNPYIQDNPLLATPLVPPRRSRADALVQRADQALQRGKRFYQADDAASARREFDRAIDLMLEASDQNPSDRQEYEKKLDQMVDAVHRFDLAGLGASAEIDETRFEKAPFEDILQMTFPVDPQLKNKVREQVAATVSQLPLMVTDPVLSYIHFFETRGRKTLIAGIQRSGRFRPMIQRILEEEGLPPEIIHLAQAESGFLPRAVSHAAAGGMWQFLTWRGQQYGLMQTRYTDDRMDPERATRAAARHLRDLYTEFGDWYLALAAYNCGPGVVEKAVERTGYADFWELRNRGVLPLETTNYVPIILALTIMEKNAAEYGLQDLPLDPALEYDTIETAAPTSMILIADLADAPLAEILALNPAVLKNTAPAAFPVHVPRGTGDQLMASLQLIPPEHRDTWRIHRVTTGETLASIVSKYGTSTASIVAANKLEKPEAIEGDRLIIPANLKVNPSANHSAAKTGTLPRRYVPAQPAATAAAAKPVMTHSSTAMAGRSAGQ
ncbi:MAG: transglycosylase SLT domain-containing protein [Acidobacteriia bacterium]|nr:transglycosylase SLT domain-containing protein [Terriglobia bacterium]